ncbi:MAG TPA: stage IV sporulation protein A [Firmicutes bacterium]|nr:stage IV sporulation protein A [Bacillota bacterium]
MERFDIFKDISERTGGDIYIGVVGPVRTGKSTFIKRFMENMVLPNIDDTYDQKRALDELPQSGAGKTIMTTEPKFVPDEAIPLKFDQVELRVRLVDCVGYTVEGALGYLDEDGPRMVITPWSQEPVTFQVAAEMGTRKVIQDHSTIGLVITSDGSITEIPRANYVPAEERVITELTSLGKPFIVLLNSIHPQDEQTQLLATDLAIKYNVPVLPVDCLHLAEGEITQIMHEVLRMFPVQEVQVNFPSWVEELPSEHWLRSGYEEAVFTAVERIEKVKDIDEALVLLGDSEHMAKVELTKVDLGGGTVTISVTAPDHLFYEILQEYTGLPLANEGDLLRSIRELSLAKKEYDKYASGFKQACEIGYGLVHPRLEEIEFAEPELVRQGSRCGVRIRASAPSYHIIKANINTEVVPLVGTEKQGEEFVRFLSEEFEKNPEGIWKTEFFGKTLNDLVKEGIQSKLSRMPVNAQEKLQETLSKIINEGSGGLICIII